MELVCLTGKPKSGKTTLAQALNKKGYEVINFTDMLKEVAVKFLSDYDYTITLEDMHNNKEKYRGFLQHLGTHIGFDSDGLWVEEALMGWKSSCKWVEYTVPVVFDNVRTPEQFSVLKSYGFNLVRLESARSMEWILSTHEAVDGINVYHPIESALDHVEADLTLNGDLEVEYLVWKVLNS